MTKNIAAGGKSMVKAVLLFLALCVMSILSPTTSCMAQARPLIQFQHTAWTEQSGAPSQINALAQTTDGYLWLGTTNGLFRFDGLTFEAYQLPHGQQFPHTSIQSLTATVDGGLWIGYTLQDTSFLKDGVLKTQRFLSHLHRANGTVYTIVVRKDGSIWGATVNGPIRLVSGEWQDASEIQGLDIKSSYSLFEDSHGTLWMVTEDILYKLTPGATSFERTPFMSGSDALLAERPDGTVWVSDKYGLHDLGVPLAANGQPRQLISYKDSAMQLCVDGNGALWAIGSQTGVTRVEEPDLASKLPPAMQKEALQNFTSGNGLSSDRGLTILKDHEGNIWVATADGLDRFRSTALSRSDLPQKFAFYALAAEADRSILVGTEQDGLQRWMAGKLSRISVGSEDRIPCIYRAPDGKLWLGGYQDLGYLENGRYTAIPVPNEMKSPGRDTQTMTIGPDGDLWLQTASKLGIFRLHGSTWSEIPNTASKGAAVVMTTDHAGRVWAGYMNGFLTIFDGAKRIELSKDRGLTVGNVLALYESSNGMLIGGESGLNVMRGNHPVALRFAGQNKIEGISGIMRMEDGTLWLNSLPGILSIPSNEVEQALKDPFHAMHYRVFNQLDGLTGKAPQIRPMPSIIRGVGTTLWFTTTNGVVSIDTAHILTNSISPPVSIKDVLVDGKALDLSDSLSLSKGAKDLQIDYTALSLAIPERVRFRYKLDGYDNDWQDAGTRRQAFYTNLPPGRYLFRVIACNNDGLWNDTGASVSMYLPPTFFQSWYFKLALAVLVLVALSMVYLLRMKQEASKMRSRLAERLSERERIARELHDTLFQSVEGSLLHLNAITSRLPITPQAMDQLRGAYSEVDRVMGHARSLVFDLRQPVDSQDLRSTIELLSEEVGQLSDVPVEVKVRGASLELRSTVYGEVLKIVREAVWNSFRHARPQHIQVLVEFSSRLFAVRIIDDGVGIEPRILDQGREGHWGLRGMRERAAQLKGKLLIRNLEEGGTEVLLEMKAADAYRSPGGILSLPWRWLSRDESFR